MLPLGVAIGAGTGAAGMRVLPLSERRGVPGKIGPFLGVTMLKKLHVTAARARTGPQKKARARPGPQKKIGTPPKKNPPTDTTRDTLKINTQHTHWFLTSDVTALALVPPHLRHPGSTAENAAAGRGNPGVHSPGVCGMCPQSPSALRLPRQPHTAPLKRWPPAAVKRYKIHPAL